MGADQLYGGDGDDQLVGGEGDDLLDGTGSGQDSAIYSDAASAVTIDLSRWALRRRAAPEATR